ncbi:MAG: pirin family protein [Cyclobacteriaceae bacterium]|nr:pirin family protein [Cyclobacteriaceae bacterium]MCB9238620.1 pirin family protein [Flammeovirgaceae bacterium]MCO5273232.1 pirin family protein [Cyclobacteriaceae bacterium]MCW5902331.1 pirin family protein [Cyclobacteriaceae bacterium]
MPEIIIQAREAAISTHLSVKRILPFRKKRMVGPFIFMDHAGPINSFPSEVTSMDVLPHPHIGLSTITYLFSGNVTHRDSLGVEQVIRPGEVNWMTAGKGISHSERFEDTDLLLKGGLEMLQTWVALPESVEESDPTFEYYKPDQLPVYTDSGIWMRLIAGNAYGLGNDVVVHSPLFYLHVKLEAGAKIDLPTEHSERAIYITSGSLELSGRTYSNGQMIVFSKNEEATVRSKKNSEFMILGGEPLGERFIWWNFVSSSKERIEQAKNDWKTGKIILPPNDNKEFIPLPESRSKPASSDVPPPEPLS